MLLVRKELVLVGVIYYRPDYIHLLNEFYWQVEDEIPEIPRVHKFLMYWKDHIDAPIKEVFVSTMTTDAYRNSAFYKVLH